MNFERLLKKARSAIEDVDDWVRFQALAEISREPNEDDRALLENFLESGDPNLELLAFFALKKLFPMPSSIKEVWEILFSTTISLLEKRANAGSGSAQLRIAALKALSFGSGLKIDSVESILKAATSTFNYDSAFINQEPQLPLLQNKNNFLLPEALGLLLSSMPIDQETTLDLLKRELDSQNPDRMVPALISLQAQPSSKLTDQILWIARNGEKSTAKEAVKALLACGGKEVCLVISSLLKEAGNPERRVSIIQTAASTDREEVWKSLFYSVKSGDTKIALAALRGIGGYRAISDSEKLALYSETIKTKEPKLVALAAMLAWKAGSTRSIKLLEQLLESETDSFRIAASEILAEVEPEKSVPIIITHFSEEKNELVIEKMLLSLRTLLSKIKKPELIENSVLPWLNGLLKSLDPFKRNQAAVLCGFLGPFAEKILLEALSKESHPYVLASLIMALSKCGCRRILVYSQYHDHKDPRVRANMVYAMGNCGNEAIPYLSEALNDNSSRVRAGAAYNLFLLGQLESIKHLNSMLQVPEPLSVLSACYAIGKIFKIILPILESDHPLALSTSRLAVEYQKTRQIGPGLLNEPEAVDLFDDLANSKGDRKKILWQLEERRKRRPSSFIITRLLAAMYILSDENQKAFPLMEICIRENPSDLADLLDAYRTVLKLGNLNKANEIGDKTKKLYKMLLEGCIELCRSINGSGAALMLQRLNFLKEPSMNLYNAMIQLKVLEKDTDTVMYLMTEIILARPFNVGLINKLVSMMPEEHGPLKEALRKYSKSLEAQ